MRRIDLAERCAALGYLSLSHGVIGHIETGRRGPDGLRRREVTVDEVVVLAAALGVPPIDLVIPTGRVATVELLPGRHFPIDVARRWFDGTEGIDGSLPVELKRLQVARDHDVAVRRLRETVNRFCEAAGLMPDDAEIPDRARMANPEDALRVRQHAHQTLARVLSEVDDSTTAEAEDVLAARRAYEHADEAFQAERALQIASRGLRGHRGNMRFVGDVPPPLDVDLAWIDDDQARPEGGTDAS